MLARGDGSRIKEGHRSGPRTASSGAAALRGAAAPRKAGGVSPGRVPVVHPGLGGRWLAGGVSGREGPWFSGTVFISGPHAKGGGEGWADRVMGVVSSTTLPGAGFA